MQVNQHLAWSRQGFKSPFAHRCDESGHGLQIPRPSAGVFLLVAPVVAVGVDVVAGDERVAGFADDGDGDGGDQDQSGVWAWGAADAPCAALPQDQWRCLLRHRPHVGAAQRVGWAPSPAVYITEVLCCWGGFLRWEFDPGSASSRWTHSGRAGRTGRDVSTRRCPVGIGFHRCQPR
jgi:hypothetical protein